MLASQVLEILIWHTQQKQLRRLVARPFGRPLSGRRWHPHTITCRRPKISSPKIKIYSNTTDLGCMRRPGRFVVRGVHDGLRILAVTVRRNKVRGEPRCTGVHPHCVCSGSGCGGQQCGTHVAVLQARRQRDVAHTKHSKRGHGGGSK